MADAVGTAEPPHGEAPPGVATERLRGYGTAALFLAPAVVLLGVWIVYPAIDTIRRSFFDRAGDRFVWFDNYRELFTTDLLVTAIKNNAIWVGVVPAFVTAIGLVFAVLTERVSWSVAFKTIVFMPMAISLLAAGVIWRLMYIQDPTQGTINAAVRGAKELVTTPGPLSTALPSTESLAGNPQRGLVLKTPLRPGQVARLGLTAIVAEELPANPQQAVDPKPLPNGIAGVVWRDFKPGGGTPGKVERQEIGLPGVTVELRAADGQKVATATSADDGTFAFED